MDQGLRLRISLCFWIPMSTTYCQEHWTQDQIWSTSLWQLLQNSCHRFFVDKQQEGLVNCNSRADFDLNLSKLKVTWNDLELEERRKKKMSEDAKFFLYFEKTRLKCCPSLMTKSSPRSWHRGRHVWQQLPWVNECVPENLDGKQKERCLTGCQWYSRICDETTSRYWQSVYRNVRSIRLKGRDNNNAKMPPNFWALSPSKTKAASWLCLSCSNETSWRWWSSNRFPYKGTSEVNWKVPRWPSICIESQSGENPQW